MDQAVGKGTIAKVKDVRQGVYESSENILFDWFGFLGFIYHILGKKTVETNDQKGFNYFVPREPHPYEMRELLSFSFAPFVGWIYLWSRQMWEYFALELLWALVWYWIAVQLAFKKAIQLNWETMVSSLIWWLAIGLIVQMAIKIYEGIKCRRHSHARLNWNTFSQYSESEKVFSVIGLIFAVFFAVGLLRWIILAIL